MSLVNRQRLSQDHLVFVTQVGQTASEQASACVQELLGLDLPVSWINAGMMHVEELMDMADSLQSSTVGVYARIEGQASGHAVFLLPKWKSQGLMTVIEKNKTDDEQDPHGNPALLELGKIVISAYLAVLSNETSLIFRPMLPMIASDVSWVIVSSLIAFNFRAKEHVLVGVTHFGTDEGAVDGMLLFIPDPYSVHIMMAAQEGKAAKDLADKTIQKSA